MVSGWLTLLVLAAGLKKYLALDNRELERHKELSPDSFTFIKERGVSELLCLKGLLPSNV